MGTLVAPSKPNDADTHVCGVCASALGIAFQGAERRIACPKCRVADPPMLSKKSNRLAIMRLQGKVSPERIAELQRIKEKDQMAQALEERGLTIAETRQLEQYQGNTKLTRSQASEILMTIWKDAPVEAVNRAVLLCVSYQLNPLMKHVYLVKYDRRAKGADGTWRKVGEDWVLVMGISATRLLAHRSRPYGYVDGYPRLMTPDEQVSIYGKVLKDFVCAVTILQDQHGLRAPGYGRFGLTEKLQGADKGNTPENMAMIRSERAALDRLCPGEMPNIPGLDVVDERYIDAPQAPPKVTVIEPEPAPGPRSWPNIGAFFTDANKPPDEGFSWDKPKVLQILGVKSQTDIVDLADAWNTLYLAHRREVGAELDKAAASEAPA